MNINEEMKENLDSGTLPIVGFLFVLFISESSLLVLAKLGNPLESLNMNLRIIFALFIYSGCFIIPLLFPAIYYFARERKNFFHQFDIEREWHIPSTVYFYLYFTIVILGFLGSATTHSRERVVDYFHVGIFFIGLWITYSLSHNLQPQIRYIQRYHNSIDLNMHIYFPAILFLILNMITAPLILTTSLNYNLIAAGVTIIGVILVSIDIQIIRRKIISEMGRDILKGNNQIIET